MLVGWGRTWLIIAIASVNSGFLVETTIVQCTQTDGDEYEYVNMRELAFDHNGWLCISRSNSNSWMRIWHQMPPLYSIVDSIFSLHLLHGTVM